MIARLPRASRHGRARCRPRRRRDAARRRHRRARAARAASRRRARASRRLLDHDAGRRSSRGRAPPRRSPPARPRGHRRELQLRGPRRPRSPARPARGGRGTASARGARDSRGASVATCAPCRGRDPRVAEVAELRACRSRAAPGSQRPLSIRAASPELVEQLRHLPGRLPRSSRGSGRPRSSSSPAAGQRPREAVDRRERRAQVVARERDEREKRRRQPSRYRSTRCTDRGSGSRRSAGLAPEVRLGLTRAGVTGVQKAIRIRHGDARRCSSAEISCTVDLDPAQKGVHMSRFPELFGEAIDEVVIGEAFLVETLAEHIARAHRRAAARAASRGAHRGALPAASGRLR